jgi:purine-binding chemotaxis protein CheW
VRQKLLADGTIVVLTFRVDRFSCAFRAGFVREIVAIAATTKVPGQPSILEGFLNLRGTTLPVVRLASLFNQRFQPSLSASVIVSEGRSGPLGLLVDEVESVVAIEVGDLRPLTANHIMNEWAEAEFVLNDRPVVLLEPDRLMLAEESRRIGELQAQTDARRKAVEWIEL